MQAPKIPSDFFTLASIATFTGATGAVWVFGNTFRVLFKRDSKIIAFIISLMVAYVGAYLGGTLNSVAAFFLVLLNGCLLFLTAAGVQGFASEAATPQETHKPKLHGKENIRFFTPWFK